MTPPTDPPTPRKAIAWGVASAAMYALLFVYEEPLLHWSSQGRWFFLLPLLIAFAFSYVHGNFTGEFWKSLGIRARR